MARGTLKAETQPVLLRLGLLGPPPPSCLLHFNLNLYPFLPFKQGVFFCLSLPAQSSYCVSAVFAAMTTFSPVMAACRLSLQAKAAVQTVTAFALLEDVSKQ